jgi:hypothetical protein
MDLTKRSVTDFVLVFVTVPDNKFAGGLQLLRKKKAIIKK